MMRISSTVTIIFATSNVIILVYPIGIVITIGFERLPYNGIEINLVIDSTYLPASSRLFSMPGLSVVIIVCVIVC